jgi:Terpene synthase family 2, C-terminal metal binding
VQQAQDRSQKHIRNMESYMVLRRETIGAKLAFALLEGEDDVLNDSRVVELEAAAIDIISLSNVRLYGIDCILEKGQYCVCVYAGRLFVRP